MNEIERREKESNLDWAARLGAITAIELENITDELKIREVTLKYWKPIRDAVTNENTIKKVRTTFISPIESHFPDQNTLKPGYYFSDSKERKYSPLPKEERGRYEHLAFWYATSTIERWDVVGDDARANRKASFNKPHESQIETAQTEKTEQTETTPTQTLETMNISQLELDADTQKVVENAIAHSGMSLAEFIQKACQVYGKTVMGKVKFVGEELTAVPTEELLGDKYTTHSGRAEELTKRAIYAVETHNNSCTEKSQKWHINQTLIQHLTGSKPATIKKILEKYQTRLDDHNAKHELTAYDNRKPGVILKDKIKEDINLSELVPNGFDIA
ncbi:hypothetical protein [Nostoc sp. UHCC 0870]|uniref:hypothetical protein n=1 Tax=Nostoc sp. UHCC 0870 TaxID=2914041 RepID=UPI001EDCB818|nr:hypothetical protein [Nostoc sp. UHCC 0870]UKP01600.1 hypothetical protein L6494_30710 [Nostoc sp. UHCC 0870]